MKLQVLEIRNFQGIAGATLNPYGRNLDVFGDNGTGKTTIVSALSWLLTGKDSLGRTDFDIKPLNQYGESALEGEVAVGAAFLLDNGEQLVLKRIYKEKMVKSRSAGEAAFAGHTTEYSIDGVPCQKKEYDERVKAIADPELFRALSDPFYFPEVLDWRKRREWLLRVCGDVSFEDVIHAESPDLDEVPGIIGKHTVADHRKVLNSDKTAVAAEIKGIPDRIDECKRNVRDDLPDLKDDLAHETGLIAKINSLQADRARLQAGGQDAELRAQIREAEAELTKVRADARSAALAEAEREYKKAQRQHQAVVDSSNACAAEHQQAEQAVRIAKNAVADLQAAAPRHQTRVDDLTAEYEAEDAKEYTGADECPTCGQTIPDKDRFNAVAEFNLQKSRRLEDIVAEGKAARSRLDALNGQIALKIEELQELERTAERAAAKAKIAADAVPPAPKMQELPADFTTPEIGTAERKVADLKARLASLTVDTTERDAVDAALTEAQDELETVQAHINATREAEKLSNSARARIEELKKRRQTLKEQADLIERHLHLLAQFERAQALLLSERVNPHFKLVSWKLFDEQVNGDFNPCCEATVGGVPFNSGLNNGARINAGLDIINTLSRHAKVSLPVCVDNAESVTRLFPLDAQILRFVVSEQDKTLRVEIAE